MEIAGPPFKDKTQAITEAEDELYWVHKTPFARSLLARRIYFKSYEKRIASYIRKLDMQVYENWAWEIKTREACEWRRRRRKDKEAGRPDRNG